MSSRVVRVRSGGGDTVAATVLRQGIEEIQRELGVSPDFPAEVDRAAEQAAAAVRLPELDRTDLELLTIDPPTAMDLDQALHIERDGEGYRVHYAIADVTAFVTPGDPVDTEAQRRGQTLYGADSKVPLHPRAISEEAGSLLPDQVRPALLWTITLDGSGERTGVQVLRARVRSRERLDYEQAQRRVDDGSAPETLLLLREVGELRLAIEAERGGVSLPLPEQEIDVTGEHWRLEFRELLPVESWNAQVSLLTGFAAAALMTEAKVGLLRTLPPPDPRDVQRLRRTARALGIDWPEDQGYPERIRSLDPSVPAHAAMVVACTRLLRGSGYVGFDGELPEQPRHSALAAEYAHVTAPLRRLVDRYAGEICVALCAGEAVPDWVLEALPRLPDTMVESGRLASRYENAVLNLVEAGVLADRVGQDFDGVVVDVDPERPGRGDLTVQDPAVEAGVEGPGELPLGEQVTARLEQADVRSRSVRFRVV